MGKDNNRNSARRASNSAVPSGIARLRGDINSDGNGHISLGDHARLGAVLDGVIRVGDAVIIGRTRDGGAICFTLLSGSEREKLYAGTDEELALMLETIDDAYTAAAVAGAER